MKIEVIFEHCAAGVPFMDAQKKGTGQSTFSTTKLKMLLLFSATMNRTRKLRTSKTKRRNITISSTEVVCHVEMTASMAWASGILGAWADTTSYA